jgi:hypothetical protein
MCRFYAGKMIFRAIATCFATTLLFALQSAGAQPVKSCPNGQAVQSLQPNGTPVSCLPIPNLGPLQAQLNAETAARLATEAELRASIPGGAETGIVGKYAFTGTQSCINSSRGFDSRTFLPTIVLPQTVPGPGTFVTQTTSTVSGFRTFKANQTGEAEFFAHTLGHPTVFYYVSGLNSNGDPIISAGLASGVGAATTSTFTSTFTWEVVGGKLFIYEDAMGPTGTVTSGGTRVGWISSSENVPPMAGVLGKDLRIISMVHEASGIEIGVQRNPNGTEVFRTPRVCHRERTLRRIEG